MAKKKQTEEKVEEIVVNEMIESESASLQAIVDAISAGMKTNGFGVCEIRIGDIGIKATITERNTLIMNIGTFRIEITDSETTMDQKMERIEKMLTKITDLGVRPDKMITDPLSEPAEELYG